MTLILYAALPTYSCECVPKDVCECVCVCVNVLQMPQEKSTAAASVAIRVLMLTYYVYDALYTSTCNLHLGGVILGRSVHLFGCLHGSRQVRQVRQEGVLSGIALLRLRWFLHSVPRAQTL